MARYVSPSRVSVDRMRPGQPFLFRAPELDGGVMRALTLKVVWAFAVCHLGRRVENRSWRPPRDLIGRRILIHAGAVPKSGWELAEEVDRLKALIKAHAGEEYHQLKMRFFDAIGGFTVRDALMTGVVAVATVDSCVRESADPWFSGPFGWVLRDLIVLPEPIPCRGALGLWTPPAEVQSEVAAWLS
jgi:hypothetical protein